MALFLIQHSHSAETCPTKNPEMVRALRDHVTEENAQRLGVTLLADWVYEPEHTVVLVVETDSLKRAEDFSAPFKRMGTVSVRAGETCAQVAKACLGE